MFRSRCSQMFFKTIVMKKIVNFTEKTCVVVFFNKVAGPENSNFIQKRLQQRLFPVQFANFVKNNPFYSRCFCQFKVSILQLCLKRKIWQRCFPVNFTKFLRASFDWTPPDDCCLCLPENFEKFFRKPLL